MALNDADITNINNEILFVGSFYKKPDLFIEYGQYIRTKYDLFDEATKFFFEHAEIMYKTRTQVFNQSAMATYMSETKEILTLYKKYGGWKTIEQWSNLSQTDDFQSYFDIVKKFSLLREYHRNGFDVDKIMAHSKFHLFKAQDIYKLIRGKADKIQTVILNDNKMEVLNEGMLDVISGCLKSPDMGIEMPFPILNDLLRGLRVKNMISVGMLSNAGKSRFMFKLIAFIALVKVEKVFVVLNEMSVEEMRLCLLTTVISNPEYINLHGVNICKNEREITLGLYKDRHGEFIYRLADDNGGFSETEEEYTKRLLKESEEYRKIIQVAEWIEQQTDGVIYAKDVSEDYSDKTLEFEIRRAKMINGIEYVFYDTLKNTIDKMGDWAALKSTTTVLSKLAKKLKIFVYGSIQLTDDANYIDPLELTSSNIAGAKQLKHVLDSLILCKEIDKKAYQKYKYYSVDDSWGETVERKLDPKKRYYAFVLDKNRAGEKKKLLFEVNLNHNTWKEVGEVFKK